MQRLQHNWPPPPDGALGGLRPDDTVPSWPSGCLCYSVRQGTYNGLLSPGGATAKYPCYYPANELHCAFAILCVFKRHGVRLTVFFIVVFDAWSFHDYWLAADPSTQRRQILRQPTWVLLRRSSATMRSSRTRKRSTTSGCSYYAPA